MLACGQSSRHSRTVARQRMPRKSSNPHKKSSAAAVGRQTSTEGRSLTTLRRQAQNRSFLSLMTVACRLPPQNLSKPFFCQMQLCLLTCRARCRLHLGAVQGSVSASCVTRSALRGRFLVQISVVEMKVGDVSGLKRAQSCSVSKCFDMQSIIAMCLRQTG